MIQVMLLCAALAALKCAAHGAVPPGGNPLPPTPATTAAGSAGDSSQATSAEVREVMSKVSAVQTNVGDIQKKLSSWQVPEIILVISVVALAGLCWLCGHLYYKRLRCLTLKNLAAVASARESGESVMKALENEISLLTQIPDPSKERQAIKDNLILIINKIGTLMGRLGSELNPLLTERSFTDGVKALKETISIQPKPPSALSPDVQNAATLLKQFGERVGKIASNLGSVEERLGRYDGIVTEVDNAKQQLERSATAFQETVRKTAADLDNLQKEVRIEVSKVSSKTESIDLLLNDQTNICKRVLKIAEEREAEARNALAGASSKLAEAEKRLTDAKQEQAILEDKRKAAAKASADESAKRQTNQDLRDAATLAQAQAESEHRASALAKANAEAERQSATAEWRAAELARDEAADKLKRADSREKETEKALTDLAALREKTSKDIADQERLAQGNQHRLEKAISTETKANEALQAAASTQQAAIAAREEAAEMLRQAKGFIDSLWPEGFRGGGPLAEVRREIEGRLAQNHPEAGVLRASLSRYRWTLASAISQDVPEVLSEVGRCAYRYWRTFGLTPSQSDSEARKWAGVLSAQVGPHFSVWIASPGSLKEPTRMNFKPGGPPHVTEAKTWSVLNAKNIAVKLADVV